MSIASSTMGQLQQQIDVISNNISNIDTTGYKRRDTNFNELLYQEFNNQPIKSAEIGRMTPNGIRYGVGAKLADTSLQLDQGAILKTGRDLDMALLDQNQFFQVRTEENGKFETRYTRDGSFQLLPVNGGSKFQLSTSEGYPVLGKNGPIVIDGKSKGEMNDKGQFIVTNPNNTKTVYQLAVVNVLKPQNLESAGSNLFRVSNNATVGQTMGQVSGNDVKGMTGALEKSNVDLSTEMTNLTITQKAYQFSSRAITMADQMSGLINGLR